MPEHQQGPVKHSSFLMYAPEPQRPLVGTVRNIASKEVVYCGKSDDEVFDDRAKQLAKYDDVVAGIVAEARRNGSDAGELEAANRLSGLAENQ